MKIAVIGSGISGLVAAYRLSSHHEITIFEANSYVGGHTNTVEVDLEGERHTIDTGFIVFNDRTYPNFVKLLDELGVASDPTSMSFSVSCDATGLEYNGTNFNGLFAQRSNLFRPRFYRMLRDIMRFNREAPELLAANRLETLTVSEYLQQHSYSKQFVEQYLLPMGSAIWSCPPQTFEQFPMRFIVEFYQNHGLLSLTNRPTWRVIRGGSSQYVKAMTRSFRENIRLRCPVQSVRRLADSVELIHSGGHTEQYDEVIFACHADQALRILQDKSPLEEQLLGAFPYSHSIAVLHTDRSVLPKRRRAWASWNYHLHRGRSQEATVTYNMNILQHIESQHDFCVTLNDNDRIDPDRVIRRIAYSHPIFTTQRKLAQQRHCRLIRRNRTSFCGAYWGNGFHEDGVNSALAVCRQFEETPIVIPKTSSSSPAAIQEAV
ncbi:Dehydrosqualene desaturase [Symmachiella dynata]|uniref:NAD(P)/FAD-dependent oxidoreductase n=1 Tax=Symmachiella dynata TaxID=2527995 RepID=UPI00118A474F|nr:FAD-dependent oxidoreductase [Symmachiella dynata]QDT49083.1 Dehydrosqualene desaturase [Symmachiella dynata]